MAAGADEDAFHVRIEFGEVSSGLSNTPPPRLPRCFPSAKVLSNNFNPSLPLV
jgi:hypothetical protein